MPGSTPIYGFPYPLGSDPVSDGDNVIRSLAEDVETELSAQQSSISSITPTYQSNILDFWQGNILSVAGEFRFVKVNKMVTCNVNFTGVMSGFGGNRMEIRNLPFPARIINGQNITGSFYFLDSGTQFHAGTVVGITQTSVGFYVNNSTNYFGLSPAITWSMNDQLRTTFTYECV